MASDRLACALIALPLLLAGCAQRARFPLREPMTRDTDLDPTRVACQLRPTEKEPRHVACAPRLYVSPLAWDGLDNSVFRPISKVFAVDPPRAAINVNALDEAVDSAWFTNRLGAGHPDRETLLRGACNADQILDASSAAPGSWVIDHGKDNGASLGFRVRVDQRKYMFKTDIANQPERSSAASAIGAAIYHAVGFNTSCEQVIYFDRRVLALTPGLSVTDNTGVTRSFDDKALERVLHGATRKGNLCRMQASAWLPGYLLGPFRYERTRADDPNDVVPHEDRREIRGARLVAAWLNHFDAREQNTMDVWIASNANVVDSSPGFIRHYYLDTSDVFGSEWDWDEISRRLGMSYVLDWGDIGADFVTLGIPKRPWERAQRAPGFEQFGYFSAQNFDPEDWKNEYPNPAFSRATERDNAWMARILSRFDAADIEALVTLGQFSGAEQSRYLAAVLEQRLRLILERYLLRLSPLADARVEANTRLCVTDLARRRVVRPEADFHYAATLRRGDRLQRAPIEARPEGKVCLSLRHAPIAADVPDADGARYFVVRIANGVSRFPLVVHLYDLGPARGFRVVGLERPESL
jgi:hypothetical protein